MRVLLPQEEFATLERLARQEDTTVSDYVRGEVLLLAHVRARSLRTPEEALRIIRSAQAAVRDANPLNRDLVGELIEERRREAARE